jgi:hypothetical protein
VLDQAPHHGRADETAAASEEDDLEIFRHLQMLQCRGLVPSQ